MSTSKIKILRKPEVIALTGLPRATLATRIKEGLFPPPISLGERSVGFVFSEVEATLSHMIAGRTKAEIKALVYQLVLKRQAMEV